MFSEEFERQVVKAVREVVKDVLQDEIKQDKRYNQRELCETLGIGVETLSSLNKRGLRPTKVGRQYIYLESEVNKFLKEKKFLQIIKISDNIFLEIDKYGMTKYYCKDC